MDGRVLECQVRVHPLQLGVLGLELPQPRHVGDTRPTASRAALAAKRDDLPPLAGQAGCPVVHQAAPTLEEITAGVGGLGGVLYRMGECGLGHFAGCIHLLRGPVPEARPEPMRHGGAPSSRPPPPRYRGRQAWVPGAAGSRLLDGLHAPLAAGLHSRLGPAPSYFHPLGCSMPWSMWTARCAGELLPGPDGSCSDRVV